MRDDAGGRQVWGLGEGTGWNGWLEFLSADLVSLLQGQLVVAVHVPPRLAGLKVALDYTSWPNLAKRQRVALMS